MYNSTADDEALRRKKKRENIARKNFVGCIVKSVADKVRQDNYAIFFLTLTYKEFSKFPITFNAAENHLKNFYKTVLLPVLVSGRNYHSKCNKRKHPILYAFVDEAGSKRGKSNIAVSHHRSPNSIHHHAILLVHPDSVEKAMKYIGTDTLCLSPFLDKRKYSAIKGTDFRKSPLADVGAIANYISRRALTLQGKTDTWFTVM